jgi:hypothetical protein
MGKEFIRLNEGYISKDDIILTRLSLFRVDSNSVNLVLRTHTKIAEPDIEYFQEIKEVSGDSIKTLMSSSQESVLNNSADVFVYDTALGKYISPQNIFDNFVTEEVRKYPGISD